MVSPCEPPNNSNLPHDEQAERGVIACLLLGANHDDLDPIWFYHERRRNIVITIDLLRNEGHWQNPANSETKQIWATAQSNADRVARACEQAGLAENVRAELDSCFGACSRVEDFDYHLELVREAYLRREAIQVHRKRLEAAYDGDSEVAFEGTDFETSTIKPNRFELVTIPSSDFASASYTTEFHVDHMLTVGEPCVVGGASKSLKTSISIDLGISIASGKPFLGEYRVTKPAKVGVISAESGRATIQNAAKRVCACKHLDLAELPIEWGFDVPMLTDPTHQKAIETFIQKKSIEVLVLDPAYLMLLDQNLAGNASNVFAMGSVLKSLAQLIGKTGTTLIVIHHITKTAARTSRINGEPPELEDLAMAGFAEFARQWLLLGRRSRYADGSGMHELWLRWGGSAGHGGITGLDVREGKRTDVGGRHWAVTLRDPDECREEMVSEADSKKAEQKANREQQIIDADMDRIRKVAHKFQEGEVQTKIAEAAHISNKRCGTALNALEDAEEWERFDVQKSNRKQPYPGWRPIPAKLSDTRTDSDKSD